VQGPDAQRPALLPRALDRQLDRRTVLRAVAAGGVLAAAGCGSSRQRQQSALRAEAVPAAATASPDAPSGAQFYDRGNRSGTGVAITFHGGGDRRLAEAALRHLERAEAPCTVFAIGQWLEAEPGLARRILDGGHELGNHTYTHPDTSALTRGQLRREFARCRDVLVRQTGEPGVAVRAPENDLPVAKVEYAAADAGYASVVGWDIDPQDFFDPGADLVTRRVLAQVRGGSIVFLHLGHFGTVDALPLILDGLRSRGLTPVTTSRLLEL